MTVVRRTAAALAAGGLAAAAGLPGAAPASAHGATTTPLSRTAACAAGGDKAGSAACRAALAANGRPFGDFDNLRVPGVAGKDRQYIRDGHLCSADLPEFAGLDLARTDWPSTTLTAGGKLTVRYRTTIPHEGTFRVYLTRQGYDPAQALSWADLDTDPLITATDPPLRSGAYRMSGTLPAGRTGHHLLYVVWQNSSTPDTYYSCSDLVLRAPEPSPSRTTAASPSPELATDSAVGGPASRSPEPGAVAVPPQTRDPQDTAATQTWLARSAGDDRADLGRQLVAAALVVLCGVTAAMAMLRMRRARAARGPRHFGGR
ncbi:lytic polysaccharide monooxygenase [Mangrovihabitans endophyticus]|uniref:Chitin-binding protein n=1 Tax=Mangrovihabitans endophyticus TaxID=1751298 RepID=A0A8J3FPA8_9ACTN|nr:lytic polysaccharide monooxygenase [Mangrovihabitans endophyticus]GGK91319.1 chitin-binding protein [Mangrovihabitans endophyticus]